MRIGVDLDGVCYDFAQSFREYLEEMSLHLNYSIIDGEPDKWHFYRDWGMSDEQFVQHCHAGVDYGVIFGVGYPRDDAPSAINFMKSMGNEINIITDRSFGSDPRNSQVNTREWLGDWGIQYDSLTFSADKTCMKNDMFIEDKLENYDALVAAGVDCYLVDRPWNQDSSKHRKRVKSIQQFATIVGHMSV